MLNQLKAQEAAELQEQNKEREKDRGGKKDYCKVERKTRDNTKVKTQINMGRKLDRLFKI